MKTKVLDADEIRLAISLYVARNYGGQHVPLNEFTIIWTAGAVSSGDLLDSVSVTWKDEDNEH